MIKTDHGTNKVSHSESEGDVASATGGIYDLNESFWARVHLLEDDIRGFDDTKDNKHQGDENDETEDDEEGLVLEPFDFPDNIISQLSHKMVMANDKSKANDEGDDEIVDILMYERATNVDGVRIPYIEVPPTQIYGFRKLSRKAVMLLMADSQWKTLKASTPESENDYWYTLRLATLKVLSSVGHKIFAIHLPRIDYKKNTFLMWMERNGHQDNLDKGRSDMLTQIVRKLTRGDMNRNPMMIGLGLANEFLWPYLQTNPESDICAAATVDPPNTIDVISSSQQQKDLQTDATFPDDTNDEYDEQGGRNIVDEEPKKNMKIENIPIALIRTASSHSTNKDEMATETCKVMNETRRHRIGQLLPLQYIVYHPEKKREEFLYKILRMLTTLMNKLDC